MDTKKENELVTTEQKNTFVDETEALQDAPTVASQGESTKEQDSPQKADDEPKDEPSALDKVVAEMKDGKPDEQPPAKKSSNKIHYIIIFILSMIITGMGLVLYHQAQNNVDDTLVEEETFRTMDAEQVLKEKYAPSLKAKKLNSSKVYQLRSTADSFNGLTVAVTKVQFRQDVTRLWVKVDNDSGQSISMIPATNSKLTDDNGHSYKVDPFGGDQITSIAPGTHEEILISFDPVRENASSLLFSLNSVFDMKHNSWNYSVEFEIP